MSPVKSSRLKAREAAALQDERSRGRALVEQRFDRGRCICEGCGRTADFWQRAHLFGKGRTAKVDPVVAEWPELSAALCSEFDDGVKGGCHHLIDAYVDVEMRRRLEWQAVARLSKRLGGVLINTAVEPDQAIREMLKGRSV